MTKKIEQIKKTEDGKITVLWENEKEFQVIEDDEIAEYLLYQIAQGAQCEPK